MKTPNTQYHTLDLGSFTYKILEHILNSKITIYLQKVHYYQF